MLFTRIVQVALVITMIVMAVAVARAVLEDGWFPTHTEGEDND